MKKLMFIAAVAAMGSAFATCGIEPGVPTLKQGSRAWAYNWRFVGRTTAGQPLSTGNTVIPGSACGIGGSTITGVTEIVRIPFTLDIQGYTYMCDPSCQSCGDENEKGFLGSEWQDPEFAMFKPTYGYVDMEDEDAGIVTDIAWPIGMRGEYFECHGNATFPAWIDAERVETYTLDFAGMGNYGVYGSMKLPGTISGTFSGTCDKSYYISMTLCDESRPWNCCRTGFLEPVKTVAYGNWAAKFNASAAVNYNFNGKKVNMPAWWKQKQAECRASSI